MAKPRIMGILNLTPDSFSDGGSYGSIQEAVDVGLRMMDDGADIVDVGGESTRPGATPIETEEELWRISAVVEKLCARDVPLSIDTSKAIVARRMLELGARMINDITAFRDPEMPGVCALFRCEVALMHMQGDPQTMQQNPNYGDVTREVLEFLLAKAKFAEGCGIAPSAITLDPGIGFGKGDKHNLGLLRDLRYFVESGYPIMLGVSRKGFIGRLLSEPDPLRRGEGTLAIQAFSQLQGVTMFRTHDVKSAVRVAKTLAAIQ